ncbi:MAG TPA: DUF1761 domain-containing protein [Candidatus Paceibacterota bacterium]|nr:DUF1761 domain-containing protein [Candidatus Paceibacterota bacterium]
MYQEPFTGATLFSILVAALAPIVIGYIWYHPSIFGARWMRHSRITPELADQAKRRMLLQVSAGFIASIFAACVLYFFGTALGVADVPGAVALALWCWLGFTAPALLGSVIWEQRSLHIYLINASYWLVVLIVMALIVLI